MITIDTPFTDCHGINYTNPVIQVAQANYNSNNSIQVFLQDGEYVNPSSQINHNLSYQANIWIDAAAKASGKRPLSLKDANGNEWHTITLSAPLANTAEIIAACEDHILTTIIPQQRIMQE